MSNLRARGLRHAFGQTRVLDDVDFALAPGRLAVVVGPNGSGKTTLVRILSGVLRPQSGEVYLGDERLSQLPRREVARRLAVVPQETFVPFPYDVDEMVSMGRAAHLGAFGREGPGDREVVEHALAELGVTTLARRSYPTLSGGEKQRVLLARARAQQTDTLLLDEPTAHMDLGHRLRCFEWLRHWVRGAPGSRAAAVITHDLMLAARFADDLTLLHAGRVVADGAPERVLTPERIADVYGVEATLDHDPDGGLRIHPRRAVESGAR